MKWSPQQDAALKAVSAWLKDRDGPQVFRLFGWAGTGKSTLAKHFAKDIKTVLYAAFTGKAALVMRKRGCKNASTIHSMIYIPAEESEYESRFKLNPASTVRGADLVIIDEVSMVGQSLGEDLLSFGTKVLVLGDPEQLSPVGDEVGFFTSQRPDIMLTEIHRQAADNPIIRMSIDVREGRQLEYGTYGTSRVIPRAEVNQRDILAADQILVGRNKTRETFNGRIRELKGLSPAMPEVGDKIVCLKNNKEKRLLNGQLWFVEEIIPGRSGSLDLILQPEDGRAKVGTMVKTHADFFNGKDEEMSWSIKKKYDQFTYGYVLTGHKAQGSQWDNVYLFDESSAFREDRKKWLYTCLTRAAERITVVK